MTLIIVFQERLIKLKNQISQESHLQFNSSTYFETYPDNFYTTPLFRELQESYLYYIDKIL